jgi:predicted dehydrogenase
VVLRPDSVRWGIVGTGGIATRFVDALRETPGAVLVAVASRGPDRAAAFSAQHGVERAHGSYAALAADPDVDVAYVATPHACHAADAIRMLEAGKHVLCEKPLALDAAQVDRMRAAATASGRFLMEAMWSRFLPSWRTVRLLVADGRIGEPVHVAADFGFRFPTDPTHRLFDPALGGGALLDIGVYPVHLATMVLGPVAGVHATGQLGPTGVDELVAAVLDHERGTGVVTAALRADLPCTARVSGTAGAIDVPAFMHCADHLVVRSDGRVERVDCSFVGEGMRFQVEEVHRCLAGGEVESPTMPLAESRAVAAACDEVLAQLGVRYPQGAHG